MIDPFITISGKGCVLSHDYYDNGIEMRRVIIVVDDSDERTITREDLRKFKKSISKMIPKLD